MSRILVVGGSGFIGRKICQLAVADGHEIRSVSRGGRPDADGTWVDSVEWGEADIFDPNSWRDALDGCDAVIHTVGIISITPGKGVIRERLDGDSAIITALEADRTDIPAFVLLSVTGSLAREEHLAAKRRAERTIAELKLRTTVLRLGPVYGEDDSIGHYPGVMNAALRAIDDHNWLARRFGGARPLSVTTVAHEALQAALDPTTAKHAHAPLRRQSIMKRNTT
ncbi:SDR family oxidoreductase [Haladaptatus pallidirubidus]|uniref:NAD(P)-binding domain-containing protein n=1 Tax=Haladaptatus pallidirubidus TaxID=1008152 RepID=A0AAV3UH65_9EURY|nr:NAD-dependent epimerase/dehydratase family protein [Haladaptatus pallidirubidus]